MLPCIPGLRGIDCGLVVLAVVVIRMVMGGIDGSILSLGIKAIVSDLPGDLAPVLFLVDGIVFASLLVVAGRIGDRVGHRRVFSAGILLFTVGSALCSMAPSIQALIVCRLVLGIGMTFSLPSALALIRIHIPIERQGRSYGFVAMGMALGGVIGPFLCGYIVEYMGWEPMFLLNVPLGLLALALVRTGVPHDGGETTHLPLDVYGAVLLFLTLLLLVTALQLGTSTAGLLPPILALAGAAAALIAFVWWERRAPSPFVDLEFLRQSTVVHALLSVFLVYFLYRGLLYFIPIYLSEVGKVSATGVGTMVSAAALIPALGSPLAGWWVERRGVMSIRGLGVGAGATGALAGLLFMTGGLFGVVPVMMAVLVLAGICFAACWTPLYTYYYVSVPAERAGVAGGILETTSEVAVPLAIPIVQFVFASGVLVAANGPIPVRELAEGTIPGVQAIGVLAVACCLLVAWLLWTAPDPRVGVIDAQQVAAPAEAGAD